MADEPNKTGQNQNDNSPRGASEPRRSRGAAGGARQEDAFLSPDQLFDDPEMEDASQDAPFDPGEVLNAQVEEMERQVADLTARLAKAQEDIHRHQAEIQNLHRRREKETEDASKYAIAKFAKDVVEVSDNFERAISSVPTEATHDNPVLKSLLDGVTMTERAFLSVLENHGVKRISPKDEMFDPHRHQAVMEKEDKAVPSGMVLQVYQAGYIIAERVLRPAMVVVARGGPKPVKPAPAAEAAPEPAAGESGQPETGGVADTGDDAAKDGMENS